MPEHNICFLLDGQINYATSKYLVEIEKKRAETAFSKPDVRNIPKNGHLRINISTGSVDTASSSDSWRVVLKDRDNKIHYNELIKLNTADYRIVSNQTFWRNLAFVNVPDSIKIPFDVFVIYEPANYRWGFSINSMNAN